MTSLAPESPGSAVPAGLIRSVDIASEVRESCDAVVIGSGAGGATMAAELADAGLDVVIVEEGGYLRSESFVAVVRRALRELYRDAGDQSALGKPPITFNEGRCVGGSTVINGAMSFRTPERVLEGWASEHSVRGVSPSEMERHFEAVEQRVHVAGQDSESIGRDSQLLREGAQRKGWKVIDNLRNQLRCCGCNNCLWGCPSGAKRSMLVTCVPRALSRGARLYSDCRVEKITMTRKRVSGVVGRFSRSAKSKGPQLIVEAPIVIVACGSIQSPCLLRRSGFKSSSPHLGKNLTMHPNAKVVGIFDEDVFGWHGVHQAYQVREFLEEGMFIAASNIPPGVLALSLPHHGAALGRLMADYNHMVMAACLVEDSGSGQVHHVPGIGATVQYQVRGQDIERILRGLTLTTEILFAAGAQRVLLPFEGLTDLLDADQAFAALHQPVPASSIELFSVHLMGTVRMGDDPARSVVSSFGEFHGAPGLFVSDASLFPSPVGVNPMETILALSMRNAEHLVSERHRYGV